MANEASPRPETVHIRAHTRRGTNAIVRVTAYDRSTPERGADDAQATERPYLNPTNSAKAHQKMQDYVTFFRQAAARDKARGIDNGWDLAIANLEHFLDGTGTPVVLRSEQGARMPALEAVMDLLPVARLS